MQGYTIGCSLSPAFVGGVPSSDAESVRQRRRNNNSCRQQNNVNGSCVSGVISSISSHRGEPPFGIERVFRALSRSTVRQHRRGIPRQPSKVHYVDGRSITTSAASAQPVCVPPALQTDTSTPHPAKVPSATCRMGLWRGRWARPRGTASVRDAPARHRGRRRAGRTFPGFALVRGFGFPARHRAATSAPSCRSCPNRALFESCTSPRFARSADHIRSHSCIPPLYKHLYKHHRRLTRRIFRGHPSLCAGSRHAVRPRTE